MKNKTDDDDDDCTDDQEEKHTEHVQCMNTSKRIYVWLVINLAVVTASAIERQIKQEILQLHRLRHLENKFMATWLVFGFVRSTMYVRTIAWLPQKNCAFFEKRASSIEKRCLYSLSHKRRGLVFIFQPPKRHLLRHSTFVHRWMRMMNIRDCWLWMQ